MVQWTLLNKNPIMPVCKRHSECGNRAWAVSHSGDGSPYYLCEYCYTTLIFTKQGSKISVEEAQVLTTLDLRALREADRVVYRVSPQGSFIECILLPPSDDSLRGEIKHKIPVRSRGAKEAFTMLHAPKMNAVYRTLIGHLRAGDEVILHWDADGMQNGYAKIARCDGTRKTAEGEYENSYAELHVDALFIVVKRRGKYEVKEYTYLLRIDMTPDNSARMIQVKESRQY